jgi:hypothetical protein
MRQSASCGWLLALGSLAVYAWVVYQFETQPKSAAQTRSIVVFLYFALLLFLASVVLGHQKLRKLRAHTMQQTQTWGEALQKKAFQVFDKRKRSLFFHATATGALWGAMLVMINRLSGAWQWMVLYTIGVMWMHALIVSFVVWKRLYATQAWFEQENRRESEGL